jgi:hypothetical protein
MTRPTTISAGDPVAATWGAAVALELATLRPCLHANITTASGSFGDMTGLSFPVVNGTSYRIRGFFQWSNSSTSGGPVFSSTNPGGTVQLITQYTGETSGSVIDTIQNQVTTDTGSGVATANAADTVYVCWIDGVYQCTADGTFQMRFKRNTAGTLTVYKGSALEVIPSA